MFHDLKNLLGDSLKRNQIERQVTTAQIVDAVNAALPAFMPAGKAADVIAVSHKDGVVTVRCANAAAAEHIRRQSNAICDAVKRDVPRADLRGVRALIGLPDDVL